ncbi:hypothetical protein LguiB_024220 [Lonicera macranthoides]
MSALAHLLPTGTVLAFQALAPSFSNNGYCHLANKYLTGTLICICALFCFLSSFMDTFVSSSGKYYYGFATFKGLYIINYNEGEGEEMDREDKSTYRICFVDFVHAFVTVLVFLIFGLSDSDVKKCFFDEGGDNLEALMVNLPLGAGVLASFLFMVFPSKRRGIGYIDRDAFSL